MTARRNIMNEHSYDNEWTIHNDYEVEIDVMNTKSKQK